VSSKPEGIQHHLRANKLMLEKNLLIELRREKDEGATSIQHRRRGKETDAQQLLCQHLLSVSSVSVSMRTLLCHSAY
jgi:hypothetical protein